MIKSIKMLTWMMLLTGIAYPLLITALAFLTPNQERLVTHEGKVVGSRLIAQPFSSPRYFWPRPSANNYNPLPSGGSNLGPTSRILQETVQMRKEKFTSEDIPAELLFASGSGLDPHITLQTAYFQLPRVADARHIDVDVIKNLIDSHREGGRLTEEYVNVLMLNLALDTLTKDKK